MNDIFPLNLRLVVKFKVCLMSVVKLLMTQNIADNLLKERKDVVDVKNDEYFSDSVKNDFVFSEIINYIKTMNPNKSVLSDVPSICFV